MHGKLPNFLKPGDTIEFVAPASKFNPEVLPKLETLMETWGLKAKISCPFSEEEWLCTLPEKERFEMLKQALLNPNIQAVWVVCGGYGCSPLLPYLDQLIQPSTPKLLLGFSDVTILHLFLHKKWNWPSLHAPSGRQLALQSISQGSLDLLKEWLLGKPGFLEVTPLKGQNVISSPVTIVGGNLSLVASSLGTPWQIDTQGKFLFLEEISEKAYRIDRMLHHLSQAGIFQHAEGLILGSFIQKETLKCDSHTQKIIENWVKKLPFEVFTCESGHGDQNHPIPLNYPGVFLKKSLSLNTWLSKSTP